MVGQFFELPDKPRQQSDGSAAALLRLIPVVSESCYEN